MYFKSTISSLEDAYTIHLLIGAVVNFGEIVETLSHKIVIDDVLVPNLNLQIGVAAPCESQRLIPSGLLSAFVVDSRSLLLLSELDDAVRVLR